METKLFSRRRLLFGGVPTAFVSLLGWTYFIEPRWLAITQSELLIPNLPKGWAGKRLVHITDLHAGKVTTDYLKQAVQIVNQLNADLHAFTGDFIDHTGGIKELSEVLQDYIPAKLGSFACLGNHDYGFRWSQVEVADRVAQVASRFGINVLKNNEFEADGLFIAGVEDKWSPRFNPTAVFQNWNASRASLCLCHNPDVCDLPVWGRFRGAILAGHTHGGQCKPPFLPPPLLPVMNRRYTSGHFSLDAARSLYISRGVGHTMRVRFNCRPEIAVLTLKPA